MRADGVVRQLGVVAAAHQQLPRPVAGAVVEQWVAEALGQQLARGHQLVLSRPRCEDGLDQVARDAALQQVLLDPLGAPPRERAAILGKALGIAGVVEQPALRELGYYDVDRLRLDPLALEEGAQLSDRAVADGERAAREVEGPPLLLSFGPRSALWSRGGDIGPGQAACSCGAASLVSEAKISPVSGSTVAGTSATGGLPGCGMPMAS